MSLKCQPLPWNLLLKSSKKFRQGKFSVPLALCQLYNDSVGFSLFPNLDPLWTKWRPLNSPQWISNPLPTFKDYRFFWFWWVPRGDRKFQKISWCCFCSHFDVVFSLETVFSFCSMIVLFTNTCLSFQRSCFVSGCKMKKQISSNTRFWLPYYRDFLNICSLLVFFAPLILVLKFSFFWNHPTHQHEYMSFKPHFAMLP